MTPLKSHYRDYLANLRNVCVIFVSLFVSLPIKPENAAKINFDPSDFFLKPFHLLISLILRTTLQNILLEKRDIKTFWVSFVNIVSTFFPYFISIQSQHGLHTNIVHLRFLWTSMVYICNTLPILPKIKAIRKKIATNSNLL